jgi:putative membrane protein|tara:strand:+ start:358 stop:603 length:246 start_codon:yes stop_codon:yes gene_type:complete
MLMIVFVISAIAFIFGSQNPQTITLNYMIARTELSVAQAVSLFTVLGIVIGILVTLMWRVSRVLKSKRKLASQSPTKKVSP